MERITSPAPQVDSSGERELVLSAIRVAATRSRLQTNILDSVGVALRHKSIDCAGAIAWLRDEGLLDHLPFGTEASDDPMESRPGFSALLDRIEGNGVKTVIVEDASPVMQRLISARMPSS